MEAQAGLFDVLHGTAPLFDLDTKERFDASAFLVQRIRGRGVGSLKKQFLARHHYLGRAGMPGPTFVMRARHSGQEVGLACFGRYQKPDWGRVSFLPHLADRVALQDGTWSMAAYQNRLVDESNYLDLNRLCLVPREETDAPLGQGEDRTSKGATSWFLAHCFRYLMIRNRAIWVAQSLFEHGMYKHLRLPLRDLGFSTQQVGFEFLETGLSLLAEAQLEDGIHGTGFVKVIGSMADPHPEIGHVGKIYQILRMYYCGQGGDFDGTDTAFLGARSGLSIPRRRLSKAENPSQAGHDTTCLRLAWEGTHVSIRVLRDSIVVHEDHAEWIRVVPADPLSYIDDAIAQRWTAYQDEVRTRFGSAAQIEIRYHRGQGRGLIPEVVPGKHRYLKPLGTPYWGREVLRRSKHLAAQMEAEDSAWHTMGRGPRPDIRDCPGYYPRPSTTAPLRHAA